MSDYAVLKLCTGDQLLAEVESITSDGVNVVNPIQVKTIPVLDENGEYVEQVVSSRFCQYTRDTHFTFNHKDLIFCKTLNPAVVKYYKKLVLAFGEESTKIENFYKQASEEKEVDKNFIDLGSMKLH